MPKERRLAVGQSSFVHLDVDEVLKETEKAFLLLLAGGEEVWIPKGHVSDADTYSQGDTNCTVSISAWLAEQKGLA